MGRNFDDYPGFQPKTTFLHYYAHESGLYMIWWFTFLFFISGKQIYSWKAKRTYHICNNLDLHPARNCRQPTQRQQNCSWARFWHGQMMRDPIQLSAPLRSVELFSGIQGGHINFQLDSISPAWIFPIDFLIQTHRKLDF
jgi:hypothetical protein